MAAGRGGLPPVVGVALVLVGSALVTVAFIPSLGLAGDGGSGLPGGVQAWAGGGIALVAGGILSLGRGMAGGRRGAQPDAAPREARQVLEMEEAAPEPAEDVAPEAGQDVQALSSAEIELHEIDEEIASLTKRINKARVKLGTGQISQGGYQRVVEELEERRGELEKRRVDLELQTDSP